MSENLLVRGEAFSSGFLLSLTPVKITRPFAIQDVQYKKKMPHHGQVCFQTSWLQKYETWNKIGTWCQKESESTAFCIICNKSFSISNSGFSQIKQHVKGEKTQIRSQVRGI
jgi:hypothetical protein